MDDVAKILEIFKGLRKSRDDLAAAGEALAEAVTHLRSLLVRSSDPHITAIRDTVWWEKCETALAAWKKTVLNA